MKNMSPQQMHAYAVAVERLEEWAQVNDERDQRIWDAHKAGVSNREIAKRMKISRTTVADVLGSDDENDD